MGYRKFIFATDIHGVEQDKGANEVLFKFLKIWKPEIRVLGGDLWDYANLRAKASEAEKRQSLVKDHKAGLLWAEQFQPTHFLRGNHDQRLWDLAENGVGISRDGATGLVEEIETFFSKMGTQMFPYDRIKGVLRIGKLRMIHGFGSSAHGAADKAANLYGSVLLGHFHTIDHTSISSTQNRMGRVVGCLCRLDMPYLSTKLNAFSHRHGFAYGLINEKTGEYHVMQAEDINGKWTFAKEFIEL